MFLEEAIEFALKSLTSSSLPLELAVETSHDLGPAKAKIESMVPDEIGLFHIITRPEISRRLSRSRSLIWTIWPVSVSGRRARSSSSSMSSWFCVIIRV